MEQREEKKKKTSPSSLPLDIISEILSRLPAKSVVRFGCVSKLWSSIITTDPYFTKEFETRSSTRPSLLMIFQEKESVKLFAFSVPQHHKNSNMPRSYSQHVGTYHIKNPNNRYFWFTECVKGFVCFQESGIPVVWNPSIRKFLTLPKPERNWPNNVSIRVFLGYDPIEGKHKVVCLPPYSHYEECRVLTLGSTQQSWRRVRTNHEHSDARNARCINGVLYFKADDWSNDIYKCIIMSFDVRSEKFDMIKLPYEYVWGIIIPYEGRLASASPTDSGGIKLWILEDAKKHKWSRIYFDALKHDESLKTNLKLKDITDAGEFIYVPLRFDGSFYILYYDPKRNSFRKVEFEGVADEEVMRNNGLEGISMCNIIGTIPNYIESLMSF